MVGFRARLTSLARRPPPCRCVLDLKKRAEEAAAAGGAAAAPLAGVRLAVLGLGDSNYTKFMAVSRALRRRLLDLGATEFLAATEADEVDGLEDIVEAWQDGFWVALAAAVRAPRKPRASIPAALLRRAWLVFVRVAALGGGLRA